MLSEDRGRRYHFISSAAYREIYGGNTRRSELVMQRHNHRLPWCKMCFGKGVRNVGTKKGPRYERCTCGRLTTADGERLMSKQLILELRLKEIVERGW